MRGSLRTLVFIATMALIVASSASAFAFDETTATTPPPGVGCDLCHNPNGTTGTGTRIGPHGGYLSTTSACDCCHTIHDAPTGNALLPGETVKATCMTCHDGTAALGEGVYGAIEGRLGAAAVKGGHSVETTTVVPGGSAANGGSATMVFAGPGNTLTCSDCHSPHGNNCVAPFLGERQRSYRFLRDYHGLLTVQVQNRLLKQRPGNTATATAEYGSDWCLACHAGRVSGAALHNHPVESKTTSATPYNYRQLPVFPHTASWPSSTTVLGPFGSNRSGGTRTQSYPFLWPYPRTPLQAGTLPICQQCHEDARDVGVLVNSGREASATLHVFTSVDGLVASDNPRFQNFPHETTNDYLLVEVDDNLCLNCHPVQALP